MSDGVGRIALGLVGATVGFFIGGPTGAALGYSLGSAAGGLLFAEDQTFEGPRIDDLRVQTSAYGAPIPIVYGTYQVAGNIIWLENNRIQETRHEEEVGGKGGPSATQVTYTYSASFAVGLCEGPIIGVKRIWADTILIFNNGETASADDIANGANAMIVAAKTFVEEEISKSGAASEFGNIGIYLGDRDQLPNPLMEADRGVGNVPGYRGLAYLVIEGMQLGRFGNRIPNIRVEVVTGGALGSVPTLVNTWPEAVPLYSNGFVPSLEFDNGVMRIQAGGGSQRFLYTYTLDGMLLGKETYALTNTFFAPARNDVNLSVVHVVDDQFSWMIGNVARGGAIELPDGTRFNMFNTLGDMSIVRWRGYVFMGTYFGPARYPIVNGAPLNAPDIWRGDSEKSDATGRSRFTVSVDDELFLWDWGINDAWKIYKVDEDLNILDQWDFVDTTFKPWAVYKNMLITDAGEGGSGIWTLNGDGTTTQIVSGLDEGATQIPGSPLILTNPEIDIQNNSHIGKIWTLEPPLTSTEVPLAGVLSDLATRAGLPSTDVNTSAVTKAVRGYAMSRPSRLATLIEQLRPAYQYDLVESEYQLTVVPRGAASVVTLTADDLAAHEPGQEAPPQVAHTRALDTELPRQIRLRYRDIDLDYEQGTQYATRLVAQAVNEQTLDLPIVFTADEAAKIVDSLLATAWLTRDTYRLQLAAPHSALMPSDVIEAPLDGGTVGVRIVSIDDGRPGLRMIEAAADSAAIYDSDAVGETGEAVGDTIAPRGPTKLVLLDIPLLRDQDDGPGIYEAAAGYLSGWGGAAVYRSADGGASYTAVGAPLVKAAVIGSATEALADGDPAVWDRGGAVNVRLIADRGLSSTTESNVLNGANTIAIGAHGRWEVAAFRDAVLEADGTYTLSYLLRGLFGTEWAIPLHESGDAVVLLMDDGSITNLPLALSAIGLDRLYKGVTIGGSVVSADAQQFAFADVRQWPLSPVHVVGARDATGNLTITWIRRTRTGGEWRDYTDVPLGEASEAYEVDILDGTGAVVRTITGLTSANASYTAADQTTDFGSAQSAVNVKIYQMSAAVGRGYAAEETV